MQSSKRKRIHSFAPGRVNLLGEHLDYNEGPVLPFTIERYVRVEAALNASDVIVLKALDFNEQVSIRLSELGLKCTQEGDPLPGWAAYPAGVAWALQKHGLLVKGIDASIKSNIPIGAGLSSSAAIEMAFAVLWQQIGNWSLDRMSLSKLCLQAEVEYVGLNCGLMDQFAVSHGVEGHILFFDTRSLEWEAIPFPHAALVIVDSGVSHKLAESAYNERQAACQMALKLLRSRLPDITALRDVSPSLFERHKEILPVDLQMRVRHVVEECERVFKAVDCIRKADINALGQLMFAGHASLRDLYEVSCKELDALVDIASRIPGCRGARLTGAGFGGSTINLVDWEAVDHFTQVIKEQYRHAFGWIPQVFVTHPAGCARAEHMDL